MLLRKEQGLGMKSAWELQEEDETGSASLESKAG